MNGIHELAIALTAVAITGIAVAGDDDAPRVAPWPSVVASEPFKKLGNRGYLAAVLDLQDRDRAGEASDLRDASMIPDFLGTLLPWIGEHAAARKERARLLDALEHGKRASGARPSLEGYTAEPAVEAVLRLARGSRIVMFNEEHLSSRERAFMHSVLAGLRADGFTHLACETLAEGRELGERGHPTVDTGYYCRDPVFADLLRRAAELGFEFATYEATAEESRPRADDPVPMAATNRREAAQAKNLATLLAVPEWRVVVFAGRHHISEDEGEWTPMAGILKRKHGIDPVSIDLIVMTEQARAQDESPAWLAARAAGLVKDAPVVLRDEHGAPFTALPGALDAMVCFPPTKEVDGRPDWLGLDGLRRPYRPALDADALAAIEEPLLLQAIFAGESEPAVPADQVLIEPGRPPSPLLLRTGRYVLRLVDRAGEIEWTSDCEVR